MLGLKPNLSLTQRLLALVAVAAIPALTGLVYFIWTIHQERAHEVRDQTLANSRVASLEVERIVTGTQGVLEAIASASDITGDDPEACSAYLNSLSRQLPQFLGFDVIAPDGHVICGSSSLPLADADVIGSSWFNDVKTTSAFSVGVFTRLQPDGTGYLPLALPVVRNGQQGLIVLAAVNLKWLSARLAERQAQDGSSVVIADRNGIILARQPDTGNYVGQRLKDPLPVLLHLGEPGVTETTGLDGIERIVGYQPPAVSGSGLYIGTGTSTHAAFAPIYASTWRSIGIAAFGVLAAAGIVWSLGNRLLRAPLLRILSTVDSWRAGNETVRTEIQRDGSEISLLAAATDEYMDAVLADRAARRIAEQHRSLLLREMSHRIKNLLATVQAIANQTFRDGAGPESLQTFGQRLSAMAATHDLLVSSNWQRTELRPAIEATVRPFAGDQGKEPRFVLSGPPLEITARGAFSLSMALHELCTNAAKYGALSQSGGHVDITWSLEREGDANVFRFEWREVNGPPCYPPTRQGFGTRLVRAAFTSEFGAEASLEFPVSGVRFCLKADADQILA